MTLEKILSYLKDATSTDLLEVMKDFNAYLTNMAKEAEIAAWMLFVAGLVAVLAVGLFGYKLVKPLSAILAGYVGYFFGEEIYHAVIKAHFENCPEWVGYVAGGVFAALFLFFGFVKFSYVLFAAATVGSYYAICFYFDENTLLALGGALLAGFLAITFVRTAVVLTTSFGCGLLTAGMLAGIFPKVEAFDLRIDNWMAITLMAVTFFIFATFQFVTNRRRKEYIE
jgi:hypothetical protein